eukprot:tig00001704_g9577.t1
MASSTALVEARRFVQAEMGSHDPGHDYAHVLRVVANALAIAKAEGLPEDRLEVVEMAALLHDVKDLKFSGREGATADAVAAFLRSIEYPEEKARDVQRIVAGVSFRDELRGGGAGVELPLELRCVQDADRLDAIGAIGIARCFSYGALKKRPFYDEAVAPREALTREEYTRADAAAPTLNHFPEKLLKLKGMMKTAAGRAMAEERHAFMLAFLAQFDAERRPAPPAPPR